MTKTAPLDERIATALAGTPTSADLAALLSEAKAADDLAERNRLAARDTALDPATPPNAVADARQQMLDAQFARDRIAIATQRLDALRIEAVRREQEERRQAQVNDLTARRDAMADELRTKYPKLAGDLVDLLQRLGSLDAECRLAGVLPAEEVSRPGHMQGGQPYTPLNAARIVDFERRYDGWLWPRSSLSQGAVAAPTAVNVPTVRVILTNRQGGARGAFLADGRAIAVEPGETSGEVLMSAADLPGARGYFDIEEIGPGAPVQRAAA